VLGLNIIHRVPSTYSLVSQKIYGHEIYIGKFYIKFTT